MDIATALEDWNRSLIHSVPMEGLRARNSVV